MINVLPPLCSFLITLYLQTVFRVISHHNTVHLTLSSCEPFSFIKVRVNFYWLMS